MWLVSLISLSAGRRSRSKRATSGCVGLYGAPGNGPKPVMRMWSLSVILSQHLRDLLRRDRWRDAAVGDLSFGLFHFRADRRIGAQPRHHPLLQHRPHPLHLLLPPPRGEIA